MKVSVRWTGDTTWAGHMAKRGSNVQLKRHVVDPWEKDVQRLYLGMFKAGGRTGEGEQGTWAPNSAWVTRAKGHSKPMLSKRQYQFGAMVRSLKVVVKRLGLRATSLEMENTARSKTGFDYPAHLHAPQNPGQRFTVRPVRAKALMIPTGGGGFMFRASARPKVPPPRPHIFFQAAMVTAWMNRMTNWIFDGVKSNARRAS